MTPDDIIARDIYCFQTDSILLMDSMRPESIDLVVTDPPYLQDYKTNHRVQKNATTGREALLQKRIANDTGDAGYAFVRKYCQRLYRVLKPDSALYMFCNMDGPDGEDLLGFFKREVRAAGFSIANTIIWRKDNWTAGDLDGAFGHMYEPIIFAHKGRPLIRGKRWPDVWDFARVPDKERIHPNQKPLPLLARAIQSSSDQGGIILDGCAGSGSLGLAAHSLKRRSILCELDEQRYIEMINDLAIKTNNLFSMAGL